MIISAPERKSPNVRASLHLLVTSSLCSGMLTCCQVFEIKVQNYVSRTSNLTIWVSNEYLADSSGSTVAALSPLQAKWPELLSGIQKQTKHLRESNIYPVYVDLEAMAR